MKVHSISKLVATPLILVAGYTIYLMFTYQDYKTWWLFLPVVLLVVLYTFHGEIDYWWQQKFPIELDIQIKEWLVKHQLYYSHYNDVQRNLFDQRLSLYVEVRQFKMIGSKGIDEMDDVPFDIKNILASQAIRLGLGVKDYLIGDMDRIYLYKHPFPTPKNQFLHTYEVDVEDGAIILAIDYALPGISNPSSYYNITLHAFAEAFIAINKNIPFPLVNHHGWEKLNCIKSIKEDFILKTCGYPTIDLLPVHIVAFFEFPVEYGEFFPDEYHQLKIIFQ